MKNLTAAEYFVSVTDSAGTPGRFFQLIFFYPRPRGVDLFHLEQVRFTARERSVSLNSVKDHLKEFYRYHSRSQIKET